jgi:hypothetical protein
MVVDILASQPRVTWVSLAVHKALHSLFGAAAMQDPAPFVNSTRPLEEVMGGTSAGFFPHWAAGLDGTGQVQRPVSHRPATACDHPSLTHITSSSLAPLPLTSAALSLAAAR